MFGLGLFDKLCHVMRTTSGMGRFVINKYNMVDEYMNYMENISKQE